MYSVKDNIYKDMVNGQWHVLMHSCERTAVYNEYGCCNEALLRQTSNTKWTAVELVQETAHWHRITLNNTNEEEEFLNGLLRRSWGRKRMGSGDEMGMGGMKLTLLFH